jgi:hypothetical protein
MPTTTVCAIENRAIAEMSLIMRPMKESTTSRAEYRSARQCAVGYDARGQIVLQRQRQTVVHVHLNRHQEKCPI